MASEFYSEFARHFLFLRKVGESKVIKRESELEVYSEKSKQETDIGCPNAFSNFIRKQQTHDRYLYHHFLGKIFLILHDLR